MSFFIQISNVCRDVGTNLRAFCTFDCGLHRTCEVMRGWSFSYANLRLTCHFAVKILSSLIVGCLRSFWRELALTWSGQKCSSHSDHLLGFCSVLQPTLLGFFRNLQNHGFWKQTLCTELSVEIYERGLLFPGLGVWLPSKTSIYGTSMQSP